MSGTPAPEAQTFVLITGVIGGVRGYTRIENRLAALGYRVISIDPYRSSIDSVDVSYHALARHVEAELARRGIVDATVVGHAHGGGIALRLAANAPARVSRLYLVNVGALRGNKSPVFSSSIELAPLITRVPGGRSFVRRRIVNGIRENSGQHGWLDDATSHAYADPLLDDIGRVVRMAQRLGESEEPESLEAVLGRLRAPVTLLLGALTCPASPGVEELRAIETAPVPVRVVRIAGTCHFPHEEDPDEVVRNLVATRSGSGSTVRRP